MLQTTSKTNLGRIDSRGEQNAANGVAFSTTYVKKLTLLLYIENCTSRPPKKYFELATKTTIALIRHLTDF